MRFTNRELYMLLGAVVFVALATAIVAPRDVKESPSAPVATAERAEQAVAPVYRPVAHVSPNGRYSTATWAPAPKPAPYDPTPF